MGCNYFLLSLLRNSMFHRQLVGLGLDGANNMADIHAGLAARNSQTIRRVQY